MKRSKLRLVSVLTMIFLLCCSSFCFATEEESDYINLSLIKYSGSARIEEGEEYDGATVVIDDVTRPVLPGAEFSLFSLVEGEYILVQEDLVTDENGYLTVSNLPADAEYYFQETAPAKGYILEDEYVKAIPWTDEEVITYAVSTKRALPPDDVDDFEGSDPEVDEGEEPADEESIVEESPEQELPEDENIIDDENAAEPVEESPKTEDEAPLMLSLLMLMASVAALHFVRKESR